jgi:hypothetical protein
LQEETDVKLLKLKFDSKVIIEGDEKDYSMNNILNDISIIGKAKV